ncbi:MAG: lysylphosphatidylglycerol synthase transmembrane domain-containing protein [Cyclobacteriaceae bacterium]
MPQKAAYKKYLKLFLKLGLTSLALYLVFRQVDIREVGEILSRANWWWLLPAFLLFLVSKLINALRLQAFFDCVGLYLDTLYNIRLYLVGMFYNLFLPGGIGGDGYKVFLLRKAKGVSVKSLITASLLDRVSGLVAMLMLALLFAYFSNIYHQLTDWQWLIWTGLVLALPAYYLLLRWFFPVFLPIFFQSSWMSLLLQLLAMGSVYMILLALHIDDYYADYLLLYILSVIASMMPLTLGGVGAREAVFVFVPPLIDSPVNQDTALTVSLLFFLISALTSLSGALIRLPEVHVNRNDTASYSKLKGRKDIKPS